MKNVIISILIAVIYLPVNGQLNIGSGAHWITTGNISVVLQDFNMLNNGTINAGTGSFKFTGTQNTNIHGNSMPSFYIIEIAKTNSAKVLLSRNINISSSINFLSGQIDLDGNNILLSGGANIAGETEMNRITGVNGGFIEITQSLNSPNGNNPGNLGASITSSVNLGSVTIRRGHTTQSGTGLGTSINRYYDIIPTNNSNLNATLRLKYFDAELNGQTEAGLVIYQSSNAGANWNNLSRTGNSTNANYVERTGINNLALQTLSNDAPVTNGVTGLVFTGQRKKATEVTLKWTSQTETNMSHYLVQRKLDTELDFSDRSTVNTLAPAGNSISPLNYQNVDANDYTGNTYYRLKIFTTDNTFIYSDIINVAGKTKGKGNGNGNNNLTEAGEEDAAGKSISNYAIAENSKITIGPNPNNGNFWFSVNGIEKETVARLYTIDGKLVQQFKVGNFQQQRVYNLKGGLYVLTIPGLESRKIIVNTGTKNPAKISHTTPDNSKL